MRPARREDVPFLKKDLARDKRWEQVDLEKGIIFVVEHEGEIIEYAQARLVWQIEPLKFVHGKRKGLTWFAQKRATYKLAKALIGWLGDRSKNTTGIYSFFAFIKGKRFQKLAASFGLMNVYEGGKFFGADL